MEVSPGEQSTNSIALKRCDAIRLETADYGYIGETSYN